LGSATDWIASRPPVLGWPVQVEVPDVRSRFTVQARHVLARAGLHTKVAQPAGQAALTGSIVIDQSPVPGAGIRRRGLVTGQIQFPQSPGPPACA
jgi:beta-lactam-binding protein with PASTA domain